VSAALCIVDVKKNSNIGELIKLLEEYTLEFQFRISALKSGPSSIEEETLFKYIEIMSTPKTADVIKSKGLRSPRGTVYAPSDVSDLIKEGHLSLDDALLKFVREIFNRNKKNVRRS